MKRPITIYGLLSIIFGLIGGIFLITGVSSLLGILKTDGATGNPPLVFLSFGIVMIILSYIGHNQNKNYKINLERLHSDGIPVSATIMTISVSKNTRFRGKNPYIIHYKYEYNGEIYKSRSHYLWEKPNYYTGDQIDIYVDPNKLDRSVIKIK